MVEYTLTGEQTITLETEDVTKINGVFSFTNNSKHGLNIMWSTEEFSATNKGSILEPRGERVFSDATTIYIAPVYKLHYLSTVGTKKLPGAVHCRNMEL